MLRFWKNHAVVRTSEVGGQVCPVIRENIRVMIRAKSRETDMWLLLCPNRKLHMGSPTTQLELPCKDLESSKSRSLELGKNLVPVAIRLHNCQLRLKALITHSLTQILKSYIDSLFSPFVQYETTCFHMKGKNYNRWLKPSHLGGCQGGCLTQIWNQTSC